MNVTLRLATPARCKCGCGRTAQSRMTSVFQLARGCADRMFPGSNVAAYMALRTKYGY